MSKKVDTSGLDSDFIIGQTDRTNRGAKPNPVETSSASASVPKQETIEETPQEEIRPPAMTPETVKEKEIPREENKRRRKPQPEITKHSLSEQLPLPPVAERRFISERSFTTELCALCRTSDIMKYRCSATSTMYWNIISTPIRTILRNCTANAVPKIYFNP